MDLIGFRKLVAELDAKKQIECTSWSYMKLNTDDFCSTNRKISSRERRQNHIEFLRRELRANEDLGYFIAVIIEYAKRCDFGEQIETIVQDKILSNIKDTKFRERLLDVDHNDTKEFWRLINTFLDEYYQN